MRALSAITPVVLTLNEEANLARLLDDLAWAASVVVVDSGSTDATREIAGRHANVRWIERAFDSHAAQWTFGVEAAETDNVLALDADYRVPAAFVAELEQVFLAGACDGAVAGFDYCVQGTRLWGSVYPPKIVAFNRRRARISQPGHTQQIAVDGRVCRLRTRLVHDDRKPMARFVTSQINYARLEARRLSEPAPRRWQDRLRLAGVMPVVSGLAAYVRAGGPFTGTAALRYAYERTAFECLLAMELFGRRRAHPPAEGTIR